MKLLLIHIPKTAGVSIQTNGKVPIRSHGHQTALQVYPFGKNVFSFAIVRNPYDRFLSSYYFYKNHYRGVRPIKNEIQKYKSFEDFVLSFHNFKYKDDLQFIPQINFVFDLDNKQLVNYIGRFENLNDDWEAICAISGNKHYPLPVNNASYHDIWQNEYTKEMKAIIYKLFEYDFEYFRYSK